MRRVAPVETLFVVDAMQGQDAVNIARAFSEALPLTGVVLTKLDGDARGGAALSVRHVTGKPIKFAGVGEKLNGLEPFHPERMASRILGMGDIAVAGRGGADAASTRGGARSSPRRSRQARASISRISRRQIEQMKKMGGLAALVDKLPGAARAGGSAGAAGRR